MSRDKAGHSAEYWEAFRKTKPRGGPRSVVFADGREKMERRGNRHQQTQQEVSEALAIQEFIEEDDCGDWQEFLNDGGPG